VAVAPTDAPRGLASVLAGVEFESPLAEKRSGRRRPAAKGSIGLVIVAAAAGRINKIIEPFRHVGIEDVATLLERFEAIGIEHLWPQIAVIGGRIAPGENMLKMRGAVAHRDRLRHADPLEFTALERDDIDLDGRRIEMELQVDQRGGCVFDGCPALIESARGEKLFDQRLWHRLAGFIVERKAAQHLWLQDPMLKDLGGKFNEIAGDMGAGNAR